MLKFLSQLQNFVGDITSFIRLSGRNSYSVYLQCVDCRAIPWLKYSECVCVCGGGLCPWQSNVVFFSTFCYHRDIFVTERQLLMFWSVKLCNKSTVIKFYVMRAYKVVELHSSTCSIPRHWNDVSGLPHILVIVIRVFRVQWQFFLNVIERHTASSYWEQTESCS